MGFPIDDRSQTISALPGRPSSGAPTEPARAEFVSLAQWIATVGGLGFSPIAPGTVGSLAGAFLFLGAFAARGLSETPVNALAFGGVVLCMIMAFFGLGVWAAGRAEREWGCHDDNRIVIDEVVGQLIALLPLVWVFGRSPDGSLLPSSPPFSLPFSLPFSFSFSLFSAVVTGFVLFRLFDVWKPGAVGWAERRFESGLGVMADDVVAGLYSAVFLALAMELAPEWTQWAPQRAQWMQWGSELALSGRGIGVESFGLVIREFA